MTDNHIPAPQGPAASVGAGAVGPGATSSAAVPRISPWAWRWFGRYARRYVARNFNALRLLKGAAAPELTGPCVVYLNHPSWWDPMIALLLAQRFYPDRPHYAPIDATALRQYRFLRRLGFFGIDINSPRAAAQFLRAAKHILADRRAMLWLTPQGSFADARSRPLILQPGLAHLPHRIRPLTLVPLAIEYPFWNQKLPEALAAFGEPIGTQSQAVCPADDWQRLLTSRLEKLQDNLAAAALRRNTEDFEPLLIGRTGVGGVYDLFRRAAALATGRRFSPEHSAGAPQKP